MLLKYAGVSYFLVIVHQISTVGAVYCLSCAETISPLFCHTIKKCPEGEVCFTEMYKSVNNQTYYTTGCYTPRICRSKRHSMKMTRTNYVGIGKENPLCIECCTKDGCNSQGCVNNYPQSLGPLCFNCKQSLDPSLCHNVQICQADQVCHIHEVLEFGVTFFASSCLLKGECGLRITDVLGKRALGSCNRCCSTNLCNSQCNASTPAIAVTSSTSTESTTRTKLTTLTTIASTTSKPDLYFDCWELYNSGQHNSGVYTIYPWNVKNRSVDVYCDMDTANEGYTVFQRRINGTLSFDKNWTEYSDGFGNASSEYWLGNEVIHRLTTAHANKLYIIIEDKSNHTYYETYDKFAVAEGSDDYRLSLSPPVNGTAGNAMLRAPSIQDGQTFKTPDHDNSTHHCASLHTNGGWWFEECHTAYLNGQYENSRWVDPWYPAVVSGIYFQSSVMMITRTGD